MVVAEVLQLANLFPQAESVIMDVYVASEASPHQKAVLLQAVPLLNLTLVTCNPHETAPDAVADEVDVVIDDDDFVVVVDDADSTAVTAVAVHYAQRLLLVVVAKACLCRELASQSQYCQKKPLRGARRKFKYRAGDRAHNCLAILRSRHGDQIRVFVGL